MVQHIKRYKKHALILTGIFLVGVILTSVAVWAFEKNAFKLWQLGSVSEAERMTTELTYRVEREREPLVSLTTLYEGSNDVTQQELSNAHTQLINKTGREAPLTLAWITEQQNEFIISQSAGNIPWLSLNQSDFPEKLIPVLKTAQEQAPDLIVGPLFKYQSDNYLIMALASQNGEQDGVLITVTNFDDILAEVTKNLLKKGTTLEVFHPEKPNMNFSKLPSLDSSPEAEHLIIDEIGNSQWRFNWLFDADSHPDYERSSFFIISITGLAITLLSTLAFGTLLFQNTRIETLVATRTRELRKTFRGLQRAETQLVKQERMAALGSLVAGVAHELSTPISNAMMASSVVVETANGLEQNLEKIDKLTFVKEVHKLKDAADLVHQNTWRAGDLISSFKQVSIDQTSAQRRKFNLKETIDQVVTTLGPQLRKNQHNLSVSVPDNIEMYSFPGQLGQVLTNLIINAMVHAYSSDETGHISITATPVDDSKIQITVEDDGCGMPEDVSERVFEPFFTTKLGQGGSGLGLHISYNIVDTVLGGSFTVSSQIDQGSRFVVKIPCEAPATEPSS